MSETDETDYLVELKKILNLFHVPLSLARFAVCFLILKFK